MHAGHPQRSAWSSRARGAACALLAAAVLAGCNWPNRSPGNPDAGRSIFPAGTESGAAPAEGAVGEWIIVLRAFSGPGRMQQAAALKRDLLARRWEGIGVLNDGDRQMSLVFLGPFGTYDAKVEKMRKDVKAFRDTRGDRPFALAYVRQMPTPDPAGPAEWDLRNAPGAFSLQVAFFVEPGPAFPTVQPAGRYNRKELAVAACREQREKGYEAYYYHGPTMSHVCIGSFPAEAFRKGDRSSYDPNTDTYFYPGIRELRKIFPCNLQNGVQKISRWHTLRNGRRVEKVWTSFLVRIPKPADDESLTDR